MSNTNGTGTILIRKGTPMPSNTALESEPFLPGWNAVKKMDAYGLSRKMHEVNWNFFYLAGEISATVRGGNGDSAVRRAVKRILARLQGKKFNSLEITKVVSKRFLGVPFMSVTAHSRHIQEGIGLVPARDFAL